MLKFKAKIYQYTGIYLAQKEEDSYMLQFANQYGSIDYKIRLGSWQADNGFYSRMGKFRDRAVLNKFAGNTHKALYYKVLDRLWVFKTQLMSDLFNK
jgi:hypothetical protein